MQHGERDVILLIADISGYTRFMLGNAESLAHAQMVISSLMTAVMAEARLPFVISKLEGDAIFMYAVCAEGRRWQADQAQIRARLPSFHATFARRLALLRTSNTCGCGACSHLERLSIKIVVHAGRALIYKVAKYTELAGPDVIIVHRLLKNSVAEREYLLLTDAAFAALGLEDNPAVYAPQREVYDDVGEIGVRVDRALAARLPAEIAAPSGRPSLWQRLAGLGLRMWAMLTPWRLPRFAPRDEA